MVDLVPKELWQDWETLEPQPGEVVTYSVSGKRVESNGQHSPLVEKTLANLLTNALQPADKESYGT